MTTAVRLVIIALIAPTFVHIVGAVAVSPVLYVIAIVSYPIMVIATLLLLFPLHYFFRRGKMAPVKQLPFVVAVGLAGGYVLLLCGMYPQIVTPDTFISRLAVEYAAIGVMAALCCWLLYNWGPFHVSSVRSNQSLQRTAASGRR
jgi:hypothetical protein